MTPMSARSAFVRLFTASAIVATASACGDVVRSGRAPVLLVVDGVLAANGNQPDTFGQGLSSDVVRLATTPPPCTVASPCPTVFNDRARAAFRVLPKDPTIAPSDYNAVTITRVRINYRRADGRNTPGVDVPYGFDQTMAATVAPGETRPVDFELVRVVAKNETPLFQLRLNPNVILAYADMTFYGRDQVGNDVTATASISIEFGNFADAE